MKERLFRFLTTLSFLFAVACGIAWISDLHFPVDLAPSGSWTFPHEKRFFGLLDYQPAGNTDMALICISPAAFGLLSLLFGAVPLQHLWRTRGRAHERLIRLGNGQCVNCGYDLRASMDRCPECGEVPASYARE